MSVEARKHAHRIAERQSTPRFEIVTSAGHVLAWTVSLEDAEDVRYLLERKLRDQGFKSPRYPARLVEVRWLPLRGGQDD